MHHKAVGLEACGSSAQGCGRMAGVTTRAVHLTVAMRVDFKSSYHKESISNYEVMDIN